MKITCQTKDYSAVRQAIMEMTDALIILSVPHKETTTFKIRTMASKQAIRERFHARFGRTLQTEVSY